jgi:broad specificity phosphatase PhoE
MYVYCVRHGESLHNAEGRIQGQLDVPLSDFGRQQGEAIAEALAALSADAIYASPLIRALETAEIVARRLSLPIRIDNRLKEINVGLFQGRLRAEVAQLYPDAFARWTSGEPDFVVPGGESRRMLQERGCAAFRDIVAAGHQRAAIISHGRLLVVALAAFVPIPAGPAAPTLENASITTVRYDRDGHWELTAYNQAGHLAAVGLSGAGDL